MTSPPAFGRDVLKRTQAGKMRNLCLTLFIYVPPEAKIISILDIALEIINDMRSLSDASSKCGGSI